MKKEFIKSLLNVQLKLKAKKSRFNKFGNFHYRSCEDILEGVKKLLMEEGLILTLSDHIEVIGDRYYVAATATVTDGEDSISQTAYAREEVAKKGMDASQVTGATSSYARKYALNGLFCIDDGVDADVTQGSVTELEDALAQVNAQTTHKGLVAIYNSHVSLHTEKAFMDALTKKKQEITEKQNKEAA